MTRFSVFGLAAATFAALSAPNPASAQDSLPAIAQPAKPKAAKPAKAKPEAASASRERRAGELEGWDVKTAAPKPNPRALPPGVVAAKPLPDGGLPLPAERDRDNRAPVGFDSNGNMGGMFRF